jgi:small subunit ribosomal protein S2
VIADAVAEGLMARSASQANAGREDAGQPAIGGDEPLADWERELLTGQQGDATPDATPDAAAGDAAATPLPETPAEPPTVTATEVAPVEGIPATGDTVTGTQGAQNG